jgi:phosphoglycolate phosphatase
MPFRHFIFDFDGTLADSASWVMRTFNDVAARHGFRRVSDDELQMLRGRPNREIVKYLGVPAWKLPIIATDMRARIAAEIEQIKPFAGVDALLSGLFQRGAYITIVSSNSELNVRTVLGLQSATHVQRFECGASLFGKARQIKRAIKASAIPLAQTICVGDETRDIDAAREIGVACGAVLWGYATPDLLKAQHPDYLLENLTAVLELAPSAPSVASA